MIKVKMGAIVKEIPEGALEWYLMAGWRVIENVKTDTKNKTTTRGKL
jgi:hypothetical protein